MGSVEQPAQKRWQVCENYFRPLANGIRRISSSFRRAFDFAQYEQRRQRSAAVYESLQSNHLEQDARDALEAEHLELKRLTAFVPQVGGPSRDFLRNARWN